MRTLTTLQSLDAVDFGSDFDHLQQIAEECHGLIRDFLLKTFKYQSLAQGGQSVNDHARKIKWALGHRKDDALRQALSTRVSTLTRWLLTFQSKAKIIDKQDLESVLDEHRQWFDHYKAGSQIDAHQMTMVHDKLDALSAEIAQGQVTSAQVQRDPTEQVRKLKLDTATHRKENDYFIRPFSLIGVPLRPVFVQRSDAMNDIGIFRLQYRLGIKLNLIVLVDGGTTPRPNRRPACRAFATTH